jgi:glycine/D-amino acid oxidase-like deaminating enzyme/nitrite reductase/ring-hydroxylating ferredoxin subunit
MPPVSVPVPRSLWRATAATEPLPALGADARADVVIVGGGITGATLALLLTDAGRSVVLLEAQRIGSGSTGHSTGNLYQPVADGLHVLRERWDADVVREVVRARGEAIALIERNAHTFAFACGFRRCALHWYADTSHAQPFIEREHDAAQAAGLHAVLASEWDEPLATAVGPILVVQGQAQLHPLLYVQALVAHAAARGCRVFEHSPVLDIDSERHLVATAHGTVSARHVVLATHSPKGLHGVQAEMLPRREYGIASPIGGDTPAWPHGIYWGRGADQHSVRSLQSADGDFLIVVGERHKAGQHAAASENLAHLEDMARRCFGVQRVTHRWSAQSYRAADGLPYIGRTGAGLLIATGFATDGLTWGTLAAMMLADEIEGRANSLRELYRPDRVTPLKSARVVIDESLSVAKAYFERLTSHGHARLADLAPGRAAIVELERDTVAAYRDDAGRLFTVSPICTHMKCMVSWNDVERSWDCPCHGSRFRPDGTVIEGPALAPLRSIETPLPAG